MSRLRIGIVGYGNIGRGVELAVRQAGDMELTAVFTRRDPSSLSLQTQTTACLHVDQALEMKGQIDVMMLCGGSATDLPEQGPWFARHFNIVDSFDTHAKIPQYMQALQDAAKNTTAVLSAGWDPGLFSMVRAFAGAVLPQGHDYTFWGYGVSQGHSDALRRIPGIKNAIQYTVPLEAAISAVQAGQNPALTNSDKHLRECYVVLEPGADPAHIENTIKTMPHYFADYNTVVHFISEAELREKHSEMPHGGRVFRSGQTGRHAQLIELSLRLESNPEFTGSIMTAYARAAARMAGEGCFGAKTVLDIPLSYLTATPRDELIAALL